MEENKNLESASKSITEAILSIHENVFDRILPIFPKDSQEHLAKSYSEFLLAVRSLVEDKKEKKKKEPLKKLKVE